MLLFSLTVGAFVKRCSKPHLWLKIVSSFEIQQFELKNVKQKYVHSKKP